MAINEIQTNADQASAYPVVQNEVKTTDTNVVDTATGQAVSNNTEFTLSNSTEETTGIYSPNAASVNGTNATNGTSYSIPYKSEYCYSQTGSNNYGYTNATSSCAAFALATAKSIYENKKITPDQIKTKSSTNGYISSWADNGATKYNCSNESDAYKGIDHQLAAGKPVLVHATGLNSKNQSSEHWATVVGKDSNGKYTIIDPWDGKEHPLSEMQIYKNSGKLVGYVTLS